MDTDELSEVPCLVNESTTWKAAAQSENLVGVGHNSKLKNQASPSNGDIYREVQRFFAIIYCNHRLNIDVIIVKSMIATQSSIHISISQSIRLKC